MTVAVAPERPMANRRMETTDSIRERPGRVRGMRTPQEATGPCPWDNPNDATPSHPMQSGSAPQRADPLLPVSVAGPYCAAQTGVPSVVEVPPTEMVQLPGAPAMEADAPQRPPDPVAPAPMVTVTPFDAWKKFELIVENE